MAYNFIIFSKNISRVFKQLSWAPIEDLSFLPTAKPTSANLLPFVEIFHNLVIGTLWRDLS